MSNDSQANFRGMFQDRFDRQFIPFTQPANAEKTIVNVRARYRKQPGVICISAAFTIYEDSTFFGSLAAVADRLNFCSIKYYALKSIRAKYLLFVFHFPSYFPSFSHLQQFSNFVRNTEKPENFNSSHFFKAEISSQLNEGSIGSRINCIIFEGSKMH